MDYRGLTVVIMPSPDDKKKSVKAIAEEINKHVPCEFKSAKKSEESANQNPPAKLFPFEYTHEDCERIASAFKSGLQDGVPKLKNHIEQKKSVELENPDNDLPDIKTVHDLYKRAGILLIESMESNSDPRARAEIAHALADMSRYFVEYY